MSLETLPYDTAAHLDSNEAVAAYLDAVLEEEDPELLRVALETIARARGAELPSFGGPGQPWSLLEGVVRMRRDAGVRLSAPPTGS